jgi:sugar phosphate isomerase/epimerase
MYLTGFADEAAQELAGQIKATQVLGWNAIEARSIDGVNIHDMDEGAFDVACAQLADAGVHVNCFGSTIANWGKSIEAPFDQTLAEVERAIPRMQKLGTTLIRIMSYARRDDADQMADERFRRLREITRRFVDAGITPVHENCMNYGGMCWQHSLQLVQAAPGLKLVYDTGNPAFSKDWSRAGEALQDPWDFYQHVKPHLAYVHIKDAVVTEDGDKANYTYPGDGNARIPDILRDLKQSGYDGGISIEPHMASVFHDAEAGSASPEDSYAIYLEYGRRLMAMLEGLDYDWSEYR